MARFVSGRLLSTLVSTRFCGFTVQPTSEHSGAALDLYKG
jgi:hypothetical protein